MVWRIEFETSAKKSLAKLDKPQAKRITDFLRERVAVKNDPRNMGKALKGAFSELWRYRIGDYRVVCELQDEVMVVLVVRVGHRRKIYHSKL